MVVVGEGGADGQVGVKPPVGCVEVQFRRIEGVVLVQLQLGVVVSSCIDSVEIVEAEVEAKNIASGDYCVGEGLFAQLRLLLG